MHFSVLSSLALLHCASGSQVVDSLSATLSSLTFLNSGLMTPGLSSSLQRLTQCSGFTECYGTWLCGSPKDYLWDTSNGTTMGTVQAPPLGMRSAVPLGGIGAGTFELRADGSFADWMIEGQGTALAANAAQNSKIPLKDEAFLAFYSTQGGAVVLQTSPAEEGLPPVAALNYSGAYPFSRLQVLDPRFGGLAKVELYAYSAYLPASPAQASGLPCVAFSLLVTAPPDLPAPTNVSLLLALPLGSSKNTDRPMPSDPRGQTLATLQGINASACLSACSGRGDCVWWRHSGGSSTPNTTTPDTDCPGNDIYAPPRLPFATLPQCITHCLTSVPACTGVVFDGRQAEGPAQCGNTNTSLSCCLPKTTCLDLTPKQGDVAWSAGREGNVCTLYRLAPSVEQYAVPPPASASGSSSSSGGGGAGPRSGIKGVWSVVEGGGGGLRHTRPHAFDGDPAAAFQDPASATMDYVLLNGGGDATSSPASSSTFALGGESVGELFRVFESQGGELYPTLPPTPPPSSAGFGAMAVSTTLSPGQTTTLTILFAWHTPHHMYIGQDLGNWVAGGFSDALAVAQASKATLLQDAQHSAAWVNTWAVGASALPPWMRDFMVNSLAYQSKMSVWVARGSDLQPLVGGRFRQFEAYSNCDLAPVHVLDYSMIPLALAFPELLENELVTGWAARASPNGMVREFLGDFAAPGGRLTGEMDLSAGGRVMGDVSTVFILASLACFRSTNDSAVLASLWPALTAAAQWQLGTAQAYGCPAHLQTTYDYLGLDQYTINAYNSFLHLAAMRALVVLAGVVGGGDSAPLIQQAQRSFAACTSALEATLWVEEASGGGWWRPYPNATAILSGSLHGQTWAHFLGLGLLVPAHNISAHTAAERSLNCAYDPTHCPLGLLTLPGRGGTWTQDSSPAMSMDATAAAIMSGGGGFTGSHAQAVVALYRDTLRDFWDWKDLHMGPGGYTCGGAAQLSGVGLAGQAFVNAHYARHVQGWGAYLALSGQQYDAHSRTLGFTPVCEQGEWGGGGGAPHPSSPLPTLGFPFVTRLAFGTLEVSWGGEVHVPPTVMVRVKGGAMGGLGLTQAEVLLHRCVGPLGRAFASSPVVIPAALFE